MRGERKDVRRMIVVIFDATTPSFSTLMSGIHCFAISTTAAITIIIIIIIVVIVIVSNSQKEVLHYAIIHNFFSFLICALCVLCVWLFYYVKCSMIL